MFEIDYQCGVPIYEQLINGIIRLKMLGGLKGGDALPSVRALATKLGINPNTVQKAYVALESKGIIYSAPGKGSFLAEDESAEKNLKSITVEQFKGAVAEYVKKGLTNAEILAAVNQVLEGDTK